MFLIMAIFANASVYCSDNQSKSWIQRFKDTLRYGPMSVRDVAPEAALKKARKEANEIMFGRCIKPLVGKLQSGEYGAIQHCDYNEYSPMFNFVLAKENGVYKDKSVLAYQGNEMQINMPPAFSTNLQRLVEKHEKGHELFRPILVRDVDKVAELIPQADLTVTDELKKTPIQFARELHGEHLRRCTYSEFNQMHRSPMMGGSWPCEPRALAELTTIVKMLEEHKN